jgi:hypothetical protein
MSMDFFGGYGKISSLLDNGGVEVDFLNELRFVMDAHI